MVPGMPTSCCRPESDQFAEVALSRDPTVEHGFSEDVPKMIQVAVEIEVREQLHELVQRILVLEAQATGKKHTDDCCEQIDLSDVPQPRKSLSSPEQSIVRERTQIGVSFAHKQNFDDSAYMFHGDHSLDVGELEDAAKAQCTHALSESIWEAAVFVNVKAIGLGGSACVIVGLLSNMLVQFVFTFVLFSSFLISELPKVEDIWQWRELQGHAWGNMVMATRTSLVRAICEKDRSLITSTLQQRLHTAMANYLDSYALGIPLGALLCSMVLFQWALSIGQEFGEITAFVTAVFHLPRSKSSKLSVQPDGRIAFSCSLRRALFILALSLGRLVIALLLLVLGSIWLANTLSIKDLVLNAGALILVLEMDELIFASLCPSTVKVLVRNLKPFDRPIGLEWKGLTMNAPMTLLGAVVMVFSMIVGVVLPNIDRMNQINSALCGGLKDFVFDQSALDVMAVTDTNNPYASSSQTKDFSRVAIRDVISMSEPAKSPNVMYVAKYEDFYNIKHSDVATVVDVFASQVLGTSCEDYSFMDPDSVPSFRSTLLSYFGATVMSCADLVDHCTGDSRLVRLTCPETCGCNRLHSGLYKSGQNQGCPKEACIISDMYNRQISSIPCADYNVSELARMPGWADFLSQWRDAWVESQPRLASDFRQVHGIFLAYGCGALGFVPDRIKTMLCYPTSEYGSINPYCPVSCGCRNSESVDCPSQCFWNASQT